MRRQASTFFERLNPVDGLATVASFSKPSGISMVVALGRSSTFALAVSEGCDFVQ